MVRSAHYMTSLKRMILVPKRKILTKKEKRLKSKQRRLEKLKNRLRKLNSKNSNQLRKKLMKQKVHFQSHQVVAPNEMKRLKRIRKKSSLL